MPEVLMTVEEVADRVRVKRSTVYEWIATRQLGAKRVGKRAIRVTLSDLDAFVKKGEKPAAA